jgi:muramoyltetrapeptide carboxypeptidase
MKMKSILCPRPIKIKSRVGAFSPSDLVGGDRPEKVMRGVQTLEDIGFEIVLGQNVFAQDGIRAGTVEQRIQDVRDLVLREKVSALIATYGGKACNQLIDSFPISDIAEKRIPVLGFSDIAVLLNLITATTGLVTFYGPNILAKLDQSDWGDLGALNVNSVRFQPTNVFGDLSKVGARPFRSGRASGRLFGGNLECFIYGVLLTKVNIDLFNGGIFFWESSGLTPREVDQIFVALDKSGFLARISGMVIGDAFVEECYEWFRSDPCDSVVRACAGHSFPILYAPTFGHKKLQNPIIPIGTLCELDADALQVRAVENYLEVS